MDRMLGIAQGRLGLRCSLAAVLACSACSCRQGCKSGSPHSVGGAPYDVAPLLASLRPQARSLLGKGGLPSVGGLPLYDVQLALDHGTGFSGSCRLYHPNRTKKPLSALPLLLHPNAPRELGAAAEGHGWLRVDKAQTIDGPPVKLVSRRPTLVELRFERPVPAERWVVIELHFSGRLRRLPPGANDVFSQALASVGLGGSGSGASDYGLLAVGDGIVTAASAYPMVAPFVDGAFDTSAPAPFGDLAYNGLANFRLQLEAPAGTTVVTNLADQPPRSVAGGRVRVTAVGAANRDLAIVAGRQLARLQRRAGDVSVSSVFARPDREGGQRALDVAAASLALFERRFGVYPYRELDVAEATLVGGAGGVEFPGMVLIAGMLYRKPSRATSPLAVLLRLVGSLGQLLGGGPGGARPQNPQGPGKGPGSAGAGAALGLQRMDDVVASMARFTVAHEVAHQYFAGLVGNDCRRHPAVDEPLAQFAASEYIRESGASAPGPGPGAAPDDITELNTKMTYAVYRMLGGPDLPAAQPVDRFPSAMAYAAIVYGKAPHYYLALQRRIGRARLDRALRAAIEAHRFRLATVRSWVDALARGAGDRGNEVRQLAQRWLFERHGDADLGVDGSGDAVLARLLGKPTADELKRILAGLGLHPRDLFRMLLGNAGGAAPDKGSQPPPVGDLLQKLLRGLTGPSGP